MVAPLKSAKEYFEGSCQFLISCYADRHTTFAVREDT